ncbi:MAG TPA: guanylate kinase [Myxococcota bacterium]|nr:guanylate kinase [Myxococcota bacterium]HRY97362.1 guanylate kinase [Myxococcota bacterium]
MGAAIRPGRLIVVSAPSGTGKSTLCTRLCELQPQVAVSISYTTRPPRGAERDGVEYHFVDDAEFDRLVAADAFLEWARVHSRRYGTARANVEKLLAEGRDVLFDIDVQGGFQIKRAVPAARLVFLLPPSLAELARRLRGRETETEAQVRERMRAAAWELAQGRGYECFVINDELERAVRELDAVRRAERLSGDCVESNRFHLERLLAEVADFVPNQA